MALTIEDNPTPVVNSALRANPRCALITVTGPQR